jgi:hypothetical protein
MTRSQEPNAADTPDLMNETGKEAAGGPMDPIEPVLTENQLADVLRIDLLTVKRMRRRGTGPAWVMCGGLVRYPVRCVREFLASA